VSAAVATAAVRERPIIMQPESVRAILDGRKTQTRRVIRDTGLYAIDAAIHGHDVAVRERKNLAARSPYGVPGDRLWVRETWRVFGGREYEYQQAPGSVRYRADALPHEDEHWQWRPSIFMPRWASRLTLEITEVRVQRLQEISEEDAIAEGLRSQEGDGGAAGAGFKWRGTGYEGARPGYFHTPGDGRCGCNVGGPTPAQCAYSDLWESINRKRAPWSSNPWVWAISFRKVG
jgi:hypothetical protein